MADALLTPDQQTLIALSLRVRGRLDELREMLRTHRDRDPSKTMNERAVRAAIAELEPLARMLGIGP